MTAGAVADVLHVPGLAGYVDAVESALEEAVGWAGDSAVAGAGAETLRSGGKRLRPMLVYLSAPAGGRGGDGLVAAGCAVELVHMISTPLAQVALHFGANDIQGTVMEEQIAHAAGAVTPQEERIADLVSLIREAGRVPVQRDTLYNAVRTF